MNNIGLYIDGENIPYSYFNQLFEIINKIKGKIIFKKLYCDFGLLGINGNYLNVKDYCLNNTIKPIHVINNNGKNSADNAIQFDIMKELQNKIINTYIIVSGDADFINIVNEIKEKGKMIIGIGLNNSSAKLLKKSCDEFITLDKIDKINLNPFQNSLLQLLDSYEENQIDLSKLKCEMLNKDPSFNEQNYNFKKFSLLIKALSLYQKRFKLIDNQYLEIIN